MLIDIGKGSIYFESWQNNPLKYYSFSWKKNNISIATAPHRDLKEIKIPAAATHRNEKFKNKPLPLW